MSVQFVLPHDEGTYPKGQPDVRTLTILIPRYYNPEANGVRKKIEWHKLRLTLAEMHLLFPGYTARPAKGWNREDNVRDEHLQFEVDFILTPSTWESIRTWKKMLERRFHQRAMYMKVSNESVWL